VFYFTFDANANATSPFFLQASPMGIPKYIAVGHDINRNPEVIAIGPDNQIYALKFNNNGIPVGDFFATGPSVVSVTSIQVGFNSNGFQDVFGFGLGDNQIYEETFDATGNRIRTWFLTAIGAVKSLAVST
jgi:hypothetical protein